VVKPGNRIFLNDGLVQLVVDRVAGNDVECKVVVGGELRSRKGLNLPSVNLGISAFTENDRACLEFALEHGVDAVSQSFVQRAADIHIVRAAAAKMGKQPFIIAKIERADALAHFDEILAAADGIMIARGDLGVEVPIEEIAYIQKQLIAKTNLAGQPVITATQMLESMVSSRLPTRAEATDVANAILDGTDCVMLSGESAVGKFPEEAVTMLGKIAAFTEAHRPPRSVGIQHDSGQHKATTRARDRMASLVEHALYTVPCDLVLVPTRGGMVARAISRFKPQVWIIAPSPDSTACQNLAFSYGVYSFNLAEEPGDWREWIARWLRENGITAKRVLLVAGPSPRNPKANYRIELMRLNAEEN
jgi:pyruvate kinase